MASPIYAPQNVVGVAAVLLMSTLLALMCVLLFGCP
jgi:hypothetical protein